MSLDNPPFWFKVLAALGLFGLAYWVSEDSKKGKKNLSAPLPPPGPGQDAPVVEEKAPAEAAPRRNVFQKAFAIPGVGGLLGTVVGAILPFALGIVLIPDEIRASTYGMVYMFAAISLWNLAFTLFTKVRISFLFLPLWLWSIFGILYSIYEIRHPQP